MLGVLIKYAIVVRSLINYYVLTEKVSLSSEVKDIFTSFYGITITLQQHAILIWSVLCKIKDDVLWI